MNLNLQNKVVVVTGGARGIGRATAERFEAEGAHVFVWDLPDVDVTDRVRSSARRPRSSRSTVTSTCW